MNGMVTFFRRYRTQLWVLAGFAGLFLLLWATGIGCLFYHITGIPCPGCGMTRAMLSALRGDLASAWRYHPLFWLVPPLALLAFFKPQAFSAVWARRMAWGLLVLVLVVYGWRMMAYFPDHAPMEYQPDAILPRLFALWKGD